MTDVIATGYVQKINATTAIKPKQLVLMDRDRLRGKTGSEETGSNNN